MSDVSRARRRIPADYRPLLHEALATGWTIHHRSRHVLLRHPDGRTVSFPSTPGDRRTLANTRAALRRGTGHG